MILDMYNRKQDKNNNNNNNKYDIYLFLQCREKLRPA